MHYLPAGLDAPAGNARAPGGGGGPPAYSCPACPILLSNIKPTKVNGNQFFCIHVLSSGLSSSSFFPSLWETCPLAELLACCKAADGAAAGRVTVGAGTGRTTCTLSILGNIIWVASEGDAILAPQGAERDAATTAPVPKA